MTVLDTHVWIWLASAPNELSVRAKKEIKNAKDLGIAAISVWEFSMLLSKGRINSDRDPLEWVEQSVKEFGIEILPLTPAIAVRAANLGESFHGDPADRLIVATCIVNGAKLLSKDKKIREHAPIEIFW